MQVGNQRFPHKYVKRIARNGKFVYVYPSGDTAKINTIKIIIAQGKPTQLQYDSVHKEIITGPPNLIGRQLLFNKKAKGYIAKAIDPTGAAPAVYCYPSSHLKTVLSKKAAKQVRATRGINCLNKIADKMLRSSDPLTRDYGLAIWLNNHSEMRIGAHESASVNPKERAKIINLARKEGWSNATKQAALAQAKQNTFGLLTLRLGHVTLDSDGTATFSFMGKGGKRNKYVVPLTPPVQIILHRKLFMEDPRPDKRLFDKRISYKRIWKEYKKYGVTPHIVRGAFADAMVNELINNFKVKPYDSAKTAMKRFNSLIQDKVSNRLNHTRSITEKNYLSPMTQKALSELRYSINNRSSLTESIRTKDIKNLDMLGEVILWLELGVGNTII